MFSELLLFIYYYSIQLNIIYARYIRLPPVNCSETSPIGFPIVHLLNVLSETSSSSSSPTWLFSFSSNNSITSYFLIDDLKGTITVKHRLDREYLCSIARLCSCLNCTLKLEITSISDTISHILLLPIIILDENNNLPYFSQDIYQLNVSEAIRIGTRLQLPQAQDQDQPPNNIQSYSLTSTVTNDSEIYFELVILEKSLTIVPEMILKNFLDREKISTHYYKLCAYEIQHHVCSTIIINVLDVNDNIPQFEQQQITVNISELLPINSTIIQIHAYDLDIGKNGEIRYQFSKWTKGDQTIVDTFYLDSITGWLTLIKQLDYEQRIIYEIQIQANDLGENSIPVYMKTIIYVQDENDNSAEIFTFAPANIDLNDTIISVLENITIGTTLLYLSATDKDSNDNGHLSVILTNMTVKEFLSVQKITDNTYQLVTLKMFDREQYPIYYFTLYVSDHGQPSRSNSLTFQIKLMDINDCFPVFEKISYHFNITENNPLNYVFGLILATDADEGINSQIKYKLSNYTNIFSLNLNNELYTKVSLDHEQQRIYHFDIIAEDIGLLRTIAPVEITVIGINDNIPIFLSQEISMQIEENRPVHTLIGLIVAYDLDEEDLLTYKIHPEDKPNTIGKVLLESDGKLFTDMVFDHEQYKNLSSIKFRVQVYDNQHTTTANVEVNIVDIDDNMPMLIYPIDDNSILCFEHHSPNNTILLKAYDLDENGYITFSILTAIKYIFLYPNGTLTINTTQISLGFFTITIRLQDDMHSSIYNIHIVIVDNYSKCNISYSSHFISPFFNFHYKTVFFIILIFLFIFLLIISAFCLCLKRQKTPSLSSSSKESVEDNQDNHEEEEHDTLIHRTIVLNVHHTTTASQSSSPFTTISNTSMISTLDDHHNHQPHMLTAIIKKYATNEQTKLSTFERRDNNKSSSLSSSASSTYIKISRSFDDEMV